jgi:hypothetical protein
MNKVYVSVGIGVLLIAGVLILVRLTSEPRTNVPTTTPSPVVSLPPSALPSTSSPSPSVASTTSSELKLEYPKPNQEIESPLQVKGTLPGTWFFEGQINGKLVTPDGETLATAPLFAEGEWMTESDVLFSGELSFSNLKNISTAILVIENDNPSGLEENKKSAQIPVTLR